MKTILSHILRIFGAVTILLAVNEAAILEAKAQLSANTFTFIYQGRLADDFGPGWDDSPRTWDFLFKAVLPPRPCPDFDCPWPTNCPNCSIIELGTNRVIVDKGYFTTPITMPTGILNAPFGVFLQIAVRPSGSGEFTTLSPMQPLGATPFAAMAQTAQTAQTALSVSGSIPASRLTGPLNVLELGSNSPIRVANAGVGTPGPVFVHRASTSDTTGHITTLHHPLTDGDPNAILLVTHNFSRDTSASPYEPTPVGVWYNGSRWTIYHENTSVPMPVGRAFNVMVIKP